MKLPAFLEAPLGLLHLTFCMGLLRGHIRYILIDVFAWLVLSSVKKDGILGRRFISRTSELLSLAWFYTPASRTGKPESVKILLRMASQLPQELGLCSSDACFFTLILELWHWYFSKNET